LKYKKRALAIFVVAAIALLVVYHLLFGRLFPFSPLVLGFSRQAFGGFVVYHHGQPESSRLTYLNDVVVMEEKYHGLLFKWKPEVFLCADDREYERLSGSKARFNAINSRLFVSRRALEDARNEVIDLSVYLTHELSHCLLQQHISLLKAMEMPRWLMEGTAMDCAGQVGVGIYPSQSSVYESVAKGIFCEPEDFGSCFFEAEKGTALTCSIENKTAFFYSEFGCLVAFLRSSHGEQRYQAFLKDIVQSGTLDVERSFERVYGTKFSDEVERFKAETKGQGQAASPENLPDR
jgi:hypothetical protein